MKVPHAEALAEHLLQPRGQPLDDLLAVARALLAGLLDLDDLAADLPVGLDHRRVDGAGDLVPGPLEDLCDSFVELVIGHGFALLSVLVPLIKGIDYLAALTHFSPNFTAAA